MQDNDFFGEVRFSTIVVYTHPLRIAERPKTKRVQLAKIECYYRDRHEVIKLFKEMNNNIKGIMSEFIYTEIPNLSD